MDNLLYNVVNYENNKKKFLFGIGLFIVIFLSSFYNITFGLFVGLLIYSLVISFVYTTDKNTEINNTQKLELKKEQVKDTENKDIVDFLFYLKSYQIYSEDIYLNIKTLFDNFIRLYDDCIINTDLINSYYDTMVGLKINILRNIKSFDLNGYHYTEGNIKLEDIQNRAEKIIDNYLDDLILINNKTIYYNGFNIKTKKNLNQKVLPSNFLDYNNEYIKGIKMFDVNNL